MSYKKVPRNIKSSQRVLKIERLKFERNCLRGAAKPMTIEEAKALGPIDLEVFKANAGSLFPLIVSMVGNGLSIPAIEKELGINRRLLQNLLFYYPKIRAAIVSARAIKSDDRILSTMTMTD